MRNALLKRDLGASLELREASLRPNSYRADDNSHRSGDRHRFADPAP